MDRRELLTGLPLAIGAGALLASKPALAADPSYYTEVADGAVIVSPASTSPGANWSPQTLQGAINLAQSTGKPLTILAGTYLTSGLVISNPIAIVGGPGDVLFLPAGANCFSLDIRPSSTTPLTGVSIRGINFWGANEPFASGVDASQRFVDYWLSLLGAFNGLITAYLVNGLVIERCNIGGSPSCGVALWQCQNAQICNNEIQGNSIALYSANGSVNLFADNFVHNNTNEGIFIEQATPAQDFSVIRNNRIAYTGATFGAGSGQVAGSGQYGNAILAVYAWNVIAAGNTCVYSAFSGIRMNGCFNSSITDNQIYQCGETAIMYECPASSGPTSPNRYEGGVIASNVVNIAGRGIAVTNGYLGGRRVTVTGNHVKSVQNSTLTTTDPSFPAIQTTGAGIAAENDVIVSSNIIEDCAGPGIVSLCGADIGNSAQHVVSITGNVVRNAPIGIGFFKDSSLGNTLIQGNVLQGYGTGAIMAVNNSCTQAGCSYPPEDGVDWGRASGGVYTGKPYPNVLVGLNFAV